MLTELIKQLQDNDSELECVDLSNQRIEHETLLSLFSALHKNTYLRILKLVNINLDFDDLYPLVKALQANKSIKILDLSSNPFGHCGIAVFCRALKTNTTLVDLTLKSIPITGLDEMELCDTLLSNTSIVSLELDAPFQDLVKGFLLRNCLQALKPKCPFESIQEASEKNSDLTIDEAIFTVNFSLSSLIQKKLSDYLLKFSSKPLLSEQYRLLIIRKAINTKISTFLKADLLRLANLLNSVNQNIDLQNASFLSCLFDYHYTQLFELIKTIVAEIRPSLSYTDLQICCSGFIDIIYNMIRTMHISGLVHLWCPEALLGKLLPSETAEQQVILAEALRRAAQTEDHFSLQLLSFYVKNIDSKEPSLRSDHDYVQIVADTTGNSRTLEVLMQPDTTKNLPLNIQETKTSISEEELLIRTWNKDYCSVKVQLPSNRELLLNKAFVKAASKGAIQDLQKLSKYVSDISWADNRGDTAAHYAASYASKTKDRRCFDFLKKAKANLSLQNNKFCTPLDLWDFERNPDEELKKLATEINQAEALSY